MGHYDTTWADLPLELQDEIIVLAAAANPPLLGSTICHQLGWRAMTLVCKYWEDVIMHNRRLWAAIHDQDPAILPVAIARADGSPLEYCLTSDNVRCVYTMHARVEAMACRQFDPNRYTHIEVDRHDAAMAHMRKMLTMETTTVEYLRMIYNQPAWGIDARMRRFNRSAESILSAPRLRHAVLKGICVKIAGSDLRTLTIDFSGFSTFTRPPLSVLCDVFNAVKSTLTELYLWQACGFCVSERTPIVFTKLSTIAIEGSMTDVLSIFNRLRVPPDAKRIIKVAAFRRTTVGMADLFVIPLFGADWDCLRLEIGQDQSQGGVLHVQALQQSAAETGDGLDGARCVAKIDLRSTEVSSISWLELMRRVIRLGSKPGMRVHIQIPDTHIKVAGNGKLTVGLGTVDRIGAQELEKVKISVSRM
ncbi:hypothetical protein PENSPDRAFT_687153 [Peniophora sp. CONT]|nr:hypothetical protein PENSPDRAFT_687153 [Peniophora sp. CONT]